MVVFFILRHADMLILNSKLKVNLEIYVDKAKNHNNAIMNYTY